MKNLGVVYRSPRAEREFQVSDHSFLPTFGQTHHPLFLVIVPFIRILAGRNNASPTKTTH